MADKNVVKGRRCKSGHWTFQFGYEDPALVGAQLSGDSGVVDGNSTSGEPKLPLFHPTANPAALKVVMVEVPKVAQCENILSPTLSDDGIADKYLEASQGDLKEMQNNDFGSKAVSEQDQGAVASLGLYDEGKPSCSEWYTVPRSPRYKAATGPWQPIELLDTTQIDKMYLGSRAKADKGLPVGPGPRSPVSKGVESTANPRGQSVPIAITQTSASKNKTERILWKNTPPVLNSKSMPLVLTSLLPEPRKYSIRPPDDMTKSQNGQVGFVVWVNNLSDCTTYDELEALVSPYGSILKLHLADNRETGCWGFGYVHYEFKEDAAKAIAELDGKAFHNAILNVVWSNPPAKASPSL